MYKKCRDCYKDGKLPNIESCIKCEDELKAKNDESNNYIKHLHNLCGNETDKQYKYKQALIEIKQLLEDALDTDRTNAEQSFDNLYKAIELCKVVEE